MEECFTDRETLGKFVDELIKKKALPVDNADELNELRESSIKSLDEKIITAIFNSLDEEQKQEIEKLFDQEEQNPTVFSEFFERTGIDVEKIMMDTMQEFEKEFLGGEDA